MSLLNLLARREAAPAARRDRSKSRPVLESLEGRVVLSTMKPAVPAVAPPVGPMSPPAAPHVQSFQTAGTTATTPAVQTGTAFNMQWKCYYSNVSKQYFLNIQNAAGGLQVAVSRTKEAVFFTAKTWNGSQVVTSTVRGPSLPQNATVVIRNFATAGDNVLTKTTGAYWSMSTLPRVDVSYLSTPKGQIKLTYVYNSINNSGTITVDNIKGVGNIFYSANRLNPRPNDGRPVDSPTANPISSIDFVLQGGGDYVGSVGIFHTGEADPTLNFVINHNGGDYYTIRQGAL
ncbi:MAG: hypothetical protein U0835_00895 [Isosphaeraceae bacterium]